MKPRIKKKGAGDVERECVVDTIFLHLRQRVTVDTHIVPDMGLLCNRRTTPN